LKKFKQAETFGSGRFGDAGEWIVKIETLLKAIRLTKSGAVLKPEETHSAPEVVAPQPEPEEEAPAPRRAPAPKPAPTPGDGI